MPFICQSRSCHFCRSTKSSSASSPNIFARGGKNAFSLTFRDFRWHKNKIIFFYLLHIDFGPLVLIFCKNKREGFFHPDCVMPSTSLSSSLNITHQIYEISAISTSISLYYFIRMKFLPARRGTWPQHWPRNGRQRSRNRLGIHSFVLLSTLPSANQPCHTTFKRQQRVSGLGVCMCEQNFSPTQKSRKRKSKTLCVTISFQIQSCAFAIVNLLIREKLAKAKPFYTFCALYTNTLRLRFQKHTTTANQTGQISAVTTCSFVSFDCFVSDKIVL